MARTSPWQNSRRRQKCSRSSDEHYRLRHVPVQRLETGQRGSRRVWIWPYLCMAANTRKGAKKTGLINCPNQVQQYQYRVHLQKSRVKDSLPRTNPWDQSLFKTWVRDAGWCKTLKLNQLMMFLVSDASVVLKNISKNFKKNKTKQWRLLTKR